MKKILIAMLGLLAGASPALAHHPLGGMPMETFSHGLLSGLGHPLLGFDHLFFVLAVGIAAVYTGRRFSAPLAYIGAMLAGCLLMTQGVGLPAKEIVIGVSLLVVGYILVSGRALSLTPAIALFAVFGLFHGSAFGDSIAAQEAGVSMSVLLGYLLGLGILQYGLAIGAGLALEKIWNASEASAVQARIAGGIVAGVGAFLCLENAEGIVFGMMGVGV